MLSGLDRDGDGNPINDIAGMARGLFTRLLHPSSPCWRGRGWLLSFGSPCVEERSRFALAPLVPPGRP